jgi:hypothetical protein
MATPEGRVKDAVKKALHACGVVPFIEGGMGKHRAYEGVYWMPVAGPYSVHGVHDFVGCWRGVFWSLETKAPDEPTEETLHQGLFRIAVNHSGGIALTGVRSADAVAALQREIMRRVPVWPLAL